MVLVGMLASFSDPGLIVGGRFGAATFAKSDGSTVEVSVGVTARVDRFRPAGGGDETAEPGWDWKKEDGGYYERTLRWSDAASCSYEDLAERRRQLQTRENCNTPMAKACVRAFPQQKCDTTKGPPVVNGEECPREVATCAAEPCDEQRQKDEQADKAGEEEEAAALSQLAPAPAGFSVPGADDLMGGAE